MNSIVTEIANIIKSEDNYIKRERKIICFFLNLIKEIMALALAKVDDEMITKVKAQGYQIDKKNERAQSIWLLAKLGMSEEDMSAQANKQGIPWMN